MLDPSLRLRNAIIVGNLLITKELMARYPELWLNVDPKNNGWCNLHYASYYGNYLICFHLVSMMNRYKKVLPEIGALSDLDLVTFDGLTVLHMPLIHRHSQTLHYLLQAFSSSHWINYRGGPDLRTPLHYCCVYGFSEGLKLLLEFGADWTVTDANGDTCLHLSFEYGHLDCLETLVKSVASLCAARILDETSMDGSFDPRSPGFRSLVSAEVSEYENLKNSNGWLPLDFAASFELQKSYRSQRDSWIEKGIDEELLPREHPSSEVSLELLLYEKSTMDHPTKLSATSSNSSVLNFARTTSLETDSIPFALSLLNGASSTISIKDFPFEDESSAKNLELPKTRSHLQSLPSAATPDLTSHPNFLEKSLQARKHSKSFASGFRSSPGRIRTPTTPQNAVMVLPCPLQSDTARGHSLRSITISPLQRPGRRSLTLSQLDDPNVLAGQPNSSETSSKSSVSGTPTSLKSIGPLSFSLVGQRRRTSFSGPERLRSAGEDHKLSGLMTRVSSMSFGRNSSDTYLRRNVSTPTVSNTQQERPDMEPPKTSGARKSFSETRRPLNVSAFASESPVKQVFGSIFKDLSQKDSALDLESVGLLIHHEGRETKLEEVPREKKLPDRANIKRKDSFRNVSKLIDVPIFESSGGESSGENLLRKVSSINFTRVREE